MSLLHPGDIEVMTRSSTNFSTFKSDLNFAIFYAFPTDRYPYKRVRVLLVHWDDGYTNWDGSVDEIQHLFQEYGFACRKEIISTQSMASSNTRLQGSLAELARAGERGDLTIFYYAGYGIWDKGQDCLELQLVFSIIGSFEMLIIHIDNRLPGQDRSSLHRNPP